MTILEAAGLLLIVGSGVLIVCATLEAFLPAVAVLNVYRLALVCLAFWLAYAALARSRSER